MSFDLIFEVTVLKPGCVLSGHGRTGLHVHSELSSTFCEALTLGSRGGPAGLSLCGWDEASESPEQLLHWS